MKLLSSFVVLLTVVFSSISQNRKICISVDDMPTVNYGSSKIDQEIILSLVSTFKQYEVPAIGFVNENKLFKNEELDTTQVALLKHWLSSGLELGNHSYSHYSYHKTDFKKYTLDITKGAKVTKELSTSFDLPYQYFRHPYLHIGQTQSKADSLNKFLADQGYIVAPVTVDNGDYLFAAAYARSIRKKDSASMQRIGNDYVNYMEAKVHYFEALSDSLFQRNINHVLLTHANLLNAHYMGKLLSRLKDHGYEFISQSEAVEDVAFNTEITHFGHWGISWIDRWALSQGKKGAFFKNDIAVPDYIETIHR